MTNEWYMLPFFTPRLYCRLHLLAQQRSSARCRPPMIATSREMQWFWNKFSTWIQLIIHMCPGMGQVNSRSYDIARLPIFNDIFSHLPVLKRRTEFDGMNRVSWRIQEPTLKLKSCKDHILILELMELCILSRTSLTRMDSELKVLICRKLQCQYPLYQFVQLCPSVLSRQFDQVDSTSRYFTLYLPKKVLSSRGH